MISPIIKWDHQENYVVPLFDSYNTFERRNVAINLSDKIFEFVQGHIIDGEICQQLLIEFEVDYTTICFDLQERFCSQALAGCSWCGKPSA